MIRLNEATHVYTVAGQVRPSVTQALSVITRGFEFVDAEVLDAARRFGNNVHLAVALFNDGDLNEDTLDPHLAKYLAQYKRFLHDTGFVVTESERIVYNQTNRYAGKFDIKGVWKRTTWLADLKSGGMPVTVGPQTAAYQHAHPEPPRKRLVLQLGMDRYKVKILEDPGDFTVFLSALNCYRFLHKNLSRGTEANGNEEKPKGGRAAADHHQDGWPGPKRGGAYSEGVPPHRRDGGGGRGFF